jgi:hypothetical protein
MNDELKGIWKEAIMPLLSYHLGIFLEGCEKPQ